MEMMDSTYSWREKLKKCERATGRLGRSWVKSKEDREGLKKRTQSVGMFESERGSGKKEREKRRESVEERESNE